MPKAITLRAGDTEPLEIIIGATGISDLSGLSAAVLYLRKSGDSANHVDGAALSVLDSSALKLQFDPVDAKNGGGNALDAEGRYLGYVKCTWTDGDITRHPDDDDLVITVRSSLE